MKTWYTSKTLWLNAIAVIALIIQTRTGFVIDPEAQTGFLALINLLLRVITHQPLGWTPTKPTEETGEEDQPHFIPPGSAGFINLRCLVELFLVGLTLMILLAGCATTSPTAAPTVKDSPQVLAGKSLLAVKSTIVTAATATDSTTACAPA